MQKINPEDETKKVSISIAARDYVLLSKMAEKEGKTFSAFMRDAIVAFVKEKKARKPGRPKKSTQIIIVSFLLILKYWRIETC